MHDLVPYDQVLPARHMESYLVKARESHQWYWASQQKKTELLIFVQYDSSNKAQARCKSSILAVTLCIMGPV